LDVLDELVYKTFLAHQIEVTFIPAVDMHYAVVSISDKVDEPIFPGVLAELLAPKTRGFPVRVVIESSAFHRFNGQ